METINKKDLSERDIYQAVSGPEEEKDIYKQFSPDFFDLVIVDECHRGSAAEESAWCEILEYFSSRTYIFLFS
jgi:type I restriction enzyme, R subunit